jgi:hypothetical protein
MTDKKIESVKYWMMVGLYLTMVETMKVFTECQDKLYRMFPEYSGMVDSVCDEAVADKPLKDNLDMVLKRSGFVVFDEVKKESKNEEEKSDINLS